jgi:serine/threonine protein kinase
VRSNTDLKMARVFEFVSQLKDLSPSRREEEIRRLRAQGEDEAILSLVVLQFRLPPEEEDQPIGQKIGDYTPIERIGAGGMGIVYVAMQEKPIRRRVALKVIRPGIVPETDSEVVIARFEAERQALALMNHPSIAKVLDAGTTDTGHPYFVMELVKGEPITKYCDEVKLPLEERLELFILVCHAIQHAHQKGIIHRDIKPSNILVAFQDGKPVPKVIDFGVAKPIDQRLTEREIYTRIGAVIGTPGYMSPEQAELSHMDVDTRSDVYSLGALLYELVTATLPLEGLGDAPLLVTVRRIKEEEPPKPSARLHQSGDSLTSIAERRRTEPAKLTRMVRGDLDRIALKALDKDRTRRYETPSALARDVERYLQHEPVEAYPPSATYKLGKLARKHKVALITAVTFVMVLVAGTIISTWFAVAANVERGRAKHEAIEAGLQRTRAETAEKTMEGHLARGLFMTLNSEGMGSVLSRPETQALRQLAQLGDTDIYLRFLEEAVRGETTLSQLQARSEQATIAAIGLNESKRDRAAEKLIENLRNPQRTVIERAGLAFVILEFADRPGPLTELCEKAIAEGIASNPPMSTYGRWFVSYRGMYGRSSERSRGLALLMQILTPTRTALILSDALAHEMSNEAAGELEDGLKEAVARMEAVEAADILSRALDRTSNQ